MPVRIQPVPELSEVVNLLRNCELPVSDIISPHPPQFFGVRSGPALVAVVGLELYGAVALLRSLAVDPAFRRRGLGHELVAYAEQHAMRHGVQRAYLLTTTAADFFLRLGYAPLARDAAPSAIRHTRQFSELCPASSAFMSKPLA